MSFLQKSKHIEFYLLGRVFDFFLFLLEVFKNEMKTGWMQKKYWFFLLERWKVIYIHNLCDFTDPEALLISQVHRIGNI
jgi:hypothetical protein